MCHPVLLLNCESSVLERLFNSDDADLKDFRLSLNSKKYMKSTRQIGISFFLFLFSSRAVSIRTFKT